MAALSRKQDRSEDKSTREESDRDPEGPTTTATIKVEDHEIDVDVKDAGRSDVKDDEPESIRELNTKQLQDLLRATLAEQSRRANEPQRRFRDFDTESLLVLQGELRSELASR